MKKLAQLVYLSGFLVLADGCRKPPSEGSKTAETADISTMDAGSKRRQGIDFTAQGTTPTWTLDIDFTKTIRFQTQNGPLLTAAVPKSQRDPRGNGILFDAPLIADATGSTSRSSSRSAAANRRGGG